MLANFFLVLALTFVFMTNDVKSLDTKFDVRRIVSSYSCLFGRVTLVTKNS